MSLGDEQIERYSRQILLREVGGRGQERLIASSAAIVGDGSLAYLCALYLAGAGVGRLGLLGTDSSPAGSIDAIAEDVSELNPDVQIELLPSTAPLAPASTFDVRIDTSETTPAGSAFAGRLAAMEHPLLAAGVLGSHGWLACQSDTGDAGGCVACVSLHERDADAGRSDTDLAPSAVGVVASLLAFEALAVLLGWPEARGSWLHYDGAAMTVKIEPVVAHPECPACARRARPRS